MGVVLSENRIARILKKAENDLRSYVTREGSVSFQTSAHLVTGMTP